MSWLRKPVSRLAPGADPRPPRPTVAPAPPPPSGGRPGIAEYTPRTVPAPPAPAQQAGVLPAWCHIRVPHPPHTHTGHGDCPGTSGPPLDPTVLALRRHIQRSDVGTGMADALNTERAGPTAEQTIRWWALTAARILATAHGDLDRQVDAILDVAARFETWIRDGSTVHEGAGDD